MPSITLAIKSELIFMRNCFCFCSICLHVHPSQRGKYHACLIKRLPNTLQYLVRHYNEIGRTTGNLKTGGAAGGGGAAAGVGGRGHLEMHKYMPTATMFYFVSLVA